MIRTKIIHGKVDILLIDGLPEDATYIHYVEMHGNHLISYHWPLGSQHHEKVPPGNWQPVNWLDKVSEDEAKELVESNYFDGIGTMYANYSVNRIWSFGKTKHSAKESLLSLVEANVKIKNEYGHCPVTTDEEFISKWFEEEAQVWKNIYLLKNVNHVDKKQKDRSL